MLFRALALAGLAVLVVGVVEAVPLVFWGTAEEHAAVDHGRVVMLVGTGVMLVAAAGLRSWLLAVAALLPVALVVVAPGTAFGLFALVASVPLALVSSVRARC
ncbi:MAG TPA: hypothetical protein VFX51_05730 [Solirubrobacteraceae bacterium]|nr:hypothetical protein [Solirubrobacteraceae bacterium]